MQVAGGWKRQEKKQRGKTLGCCGFGSDETLVAEVRVAIAGTE